MINAVAGQDKEYHYIIGIVVTVISLIAGAFVVEERPSYAVCLMAGVVGTILVMHRRWPLYLFVFCLYIRYLIVKQPSLLLIDIAAVLVFVAFIIDYLVKGHVKIKTPAIWRYYVFLIAVMIVSAVFSLDHLAAVTPILRVIIQLAAIIVIYNIIRFNEIARLATFYLGLAVIHSLINIVLFVQHGGQMRVFGFAGVYYDDLTMLAMPISVAYLIWSRTRVGLTIYSIGTIILLFGMIATHSRGPLLTAICSTGLVTFVSYYYARKTGARHVRRRIKSLFLGSLGVVALLLGFSSLFVAVGERFTEMLDPSRGTIWLRLSLWRASLMSFISDPLTGLGPGTFRDIETIFPQLRFDPAMLYIERYSAHNLFLHYLAEAGLFGALAVTALFYRHFRTSISAVITSGDRTSRTLAIGLLGSGATIFFSIFYLDGWMWSQNAHVAPLFIALTARLLAGNRQRQATIS